jgi:ectoine hydroxylase-related dioxygenase (phytanoyl-CoA dioxygenase family)
MKSEGIRKNSSQPAVKVSDRMSISSYTSLLKEYTVPASQREAFRRDGHILLQNVCPIEDIRIFRPLILAVIDEVVAARDTQGRSEDYGALFTQVSNVWLKNELVRAFIFARRFAKIAADLMGVKGVRLYHDQALVKEPGGKPTPLHQDQFYWPLDTKNTVTMWMPLIRVTKAMGTMTFASGSHRDGLVGKLPISEKADALLSSLIKEKQYPLASYDMNAGDATFHYGLTLHSAHPNTSKVRREVVTVIYYEDGAKIMDPDNEYRKVDMQVFHPGQSPGEPAASPLNPLLYP